MDGTRGIGARLKEQLKAERRHEEAQTFVIEDVDPKQINSDILKICNITREKHFKVPVLRKKTGRGGGNSNKQSTENTTNYFNQTNTQGNFIFTTIESRQNKTGKLD